MKRSIWWAALMLPVFPAVLRAQIGPPRVLVYSDNPIVSRGLKNQGSYSSGTAYLKNDVVMLNGVWYISATDGNIGNPPASSPTKWLGFSVTGTGAQGPAGPQGLQGLRGLTGATGPAGIQGPAGVAGPQGLQGLPGVAGPAGATGPAGLTGPQGLQGLQGVAGPKGDTGPQGLIGPDGANGGPGVQGPPGQIGPAGSPGVPGSGNSPGSYLSDLAQTSSGSNDGLANLTTGTCAAGSGTAFSACDIVVSPAYAVTEFSRSFSVQKSGNGYQYDLFPTAGGIARPRFSEDHRLASRYWLSINPVNLSHERNDDRTPFVFEVRSSHSTSFADNVGVAEFRLRQYEGHNYMGLKQNYNGIAIDGKVRNGSQGGGFLSSTLVHASPGDDMVNVVQHDTNGCSEPEDECNKLWRAYIQTMTQRWGGTLNATPLLDSANFGNYALSVNVGGGYNAQQSGTDNMLVDLANPYTAGNVTGILQSTVPYTAKITGDTAAAWGTHFGASTFTTLTAPIDGETYNGACPSAPTGAGTIDPSVWLVNEAGIGGVTGFCATVASTSGYSAGENITIFGNKGNIEMTKIASIVDGTHMRINVQNPHETGEAISGGGAQGFGISMLADDIAPGALFNYESQPSVTLHKFFPVVGSDSSGNLYAWTNQAKTAEFSTKAYPYTTPRTPAVIGSISTSGTSVTAVNLSETGRYEVDASATGAAGVGLYNPNGTGSQIVLAAPTLTWTGCTTPPTTVNTLVYNTPHAYDWNLQITVTNGGNCSSPSATLSNTWANPYRISPLTMVRKVLNPATGSPNDGYLLAGAINPSLWPSGSTVEIPGWIHDYAASNVTFGKYYTGATRAFGLLNSVIFKGDFAGPDVLDGVVNSTDGHNYYPTASQPIGPGVAYEVPPDGFAFAGDYSNNFRIYTPPTQGLFNVGCGGPAQYQAMPYNPCQDGILQKYSLFYANSTYTEHQANLALLYDPTQVGPLFGAISWPKPWQAFTFVNTRGTPTSSSEACATGESWDDANYHYHCVATNSIKRVALSSF